MTINIARVKSLQNQVSELEAEVERLSHSLEVQKEATLENASVASKRVEELSKDLQNKVWARISLRYLAHC